ncbi:NUDIX hydrolase [Jeotgalibacillus aurantiacus]|uniref:NUDIX hydrolase n=1 Tax=Jeotgalibacillus aurantiacus TaxID=2763266 RepID=UPI001D0BC4D0|nr:NUDIX hydrolase [Jeotgalibacillus aurantiacus]
MDYITWIRSKTGPAPIILNFAGACLFNSEGKLLLQKRGDSGKWGLPGGAIELGESSAEAAIREIFEETGLKMKIDHLIGIYSKYEDTYPNGDRAQTIVHLFKGKQTDGSLKVDGNETMQLKYFSQEELPELFNRQHEEMVRDGFEGVSGVWR